MVPLLGGGVHGSLAQLTSILYAAVAGSVDLDHIDIGGAVPHPEAIFAIATRLPGWIPAGAVERHGKDSRGRRLADTAWTGEQIAMADSSAGHSTAQHGHHVILNQQVGESFGTVSAGESNHEGTGYWLKGGKEKCLRHPEATPDIA